VRKLTDLNETDKKFQKDLNSGTAALVLLGILGRAENPMYGYQIAKLIEENADVPMMKQGTLYPVLRSLEGNDLLESEVEPSVAGPPRKYYQITGNGRTTLTRWREMWARTKAVVDTVLEGRDDD
jgi:PadR family transcriptional regulator PadR